MALYETPKIAALTFLDTKHMRAGRPHPDAETEAALVEVDAEFVRQYVIRHGQDASVTPGYFWYHEYTTGTDNHEEFMAKYAPKS